VNIPGSGSNVAISVGGISNVFVVTTTGVNVAGTLNTGAGTAVVGNLNVTTDASVGGNLILTGNLFVNGTTTTINSTTTKIIDPIVEQGGGANGATLSSNDAKDRGLLLHYYTSTPVDAFMGWKNSPGEFVLASNASVSSDAVTINNYGNLRVGNANLGNLATSSYFHGVFDSTSSSQPNISSVGTLTSLTVSGLITATNTISLASGSVTMLGNLTIGTGGTGNLTSINANLGNLATSNYFHGVFDNTSNSQPNITSLGTLASLTVAGTGSIIGSNVVSANYFTGTLTTTSQPNISSVGTLSSLNVSGYGSFYTTQDKFAALTGATGVVTHDVSQGPIFYHSSPAAAFTPNFTNVNTTNGYITVLSLLITQGSTAYMPTLDSANIQIAGTNITVKWAQGIVPAGAINTTQLVSYSLLRNASTWTVFGQMSYFS
jgi:hypothetical protein